MENTIEEQATELANKILNGKNAALNFLFEGEHNITILTELLGRESYLKIQLINRQELVNDDADLQDEEDEQKENPDCLGKACLNYMHCYPEKTFEQATSNQPSADYREDILDMDQICKSEKITVTVDNDAEWYRVYDITDDHSKCTLSRVLAFEMSKAHQPEKEEKKC